MKKNAFILYTFILLLFTTAVNPATALSADSSDFVSASIKMTWGLLIVLGIILIIYGIARKKLSFVQSGGKGAIKIIETRHLMPKKTLFLVEVAGKQYLLGAGTDSINLITAVTDSEKKTSFDKVLRSTEANSSS